MNKARNAAVAWYLRAGFGISCDDVDLAAASRLLEAALRDMPADLQGLPAPASGSESENPFFEVCPEGFASLLEAYRAGLGSESASGESG